MPAAEGNVVAIPLALGAAVSFAVANVTQMRASRRATAPETLSPRLLLRLVRDREWLVGLAASVIGYGLQASALFLAPVLLVQPLIVAELLVALPLASSLAGIRLHRREWTGAGLVAAGITAFVLVGDPHGDRTQLSATTWIIMTASVAAFVAALVLIAESRRDRPMQRATLLAIAASVCFGLLSVLTKVVGRQFQDHGLATLILPQPWMLAIVAVTGLLLTQTAFRIAPLSVSLPVIDVGEPLVASLLAALAFGESIGIGVGTAIGVGLSATAIVTGIAILDTSPIARARQGDLDLLAARRAATALDSPSEPDRASPHALRSSGSRSGRSLLAKWVRNGVVISVAVLVIEYLVVPEVVGASKNLDLLSGLNVGWLAAGIMLEAGSLYCYALLTRTLLHGAGPPISRLFRIVLATTAVAHVMPGGAAGGAGLGYQLLTSDGADGPVVGFTLATQAIGSALVLNVMLWISLLVSIPIAGLHPIYVAVAVAGVLAMCAGAAIVYTFSRGEERAVRLVRALGRRIPRVGEAHLERVVRQVGDSVSLLARDRPQLRRVALWAALNWALDAASLWSFLAALGRYVNPFELFAAYGVANLLGVIPITPGGLGIIEASAATLIVSFGVTRSIATLGVLGWRLVNFWLPIPVGALAYVSLKVPRDSDPKARRHPLSTLTIDAKQARTTTPPANPSPTTDQH
jgi:uncharacterized protein (TIRG00374 family)